MPTSTSLLLARRVTLVSALLWIGAGAGCAKEPAAEGSVTWAPWGPADSPTSPFARCKVTPGAEGGVARADTLRCEGVAGAGVAVILDVRDASGAPIGAGRLSEGPLIATYFSDKYPLRLGYDVSVEGSDAIGLEEQTILGGLAIEGEAALAEWQALTLPFRVWSIDVENQTDRAIFRLEPRTLSLTEGTFEDGAEERLVDAFTAYLEPGERRTFAVAVGHATTMLSGAAGVAAESVAHPFQLQATGVFNLTGDGLVSADRQVALPGTAPSLAECHTADDALRCKLVARRGIAIGSAQVKALDLTVSLPLDGAEVEVLPRGRTTDSVRVLVTGVTGIEGLPTRDPASFTLTVPVVDGRAVAGYPFDLRHAQIGFAAGVARAYIDATTAARFRLRAAWNGQWEIVSMPRIAAEPGKGDLWIATAPGSDAPIGATVIIVDDAGGTSQPIDLSIAEGGTYFITPTAIVPPTAPAPGTELARCFFVGSALTCEASATAPIVSAEITFTLRGRARSAQIGPVRTAVLTFPASVFPTTLTLTVEVLGGAEASTATTTIGAPGELDEGNALVVRAP